MVESACLDEPRRVDEEVGEGGPCEGVVRHSQSPVRVGVEVTDVPSARSHPDPYGRTIAGRHGGNHPAAGTVDYAPELHQVPAFCDAEVGVIRLSPLPTSARCDLQPTRMGYGIPTLLVHDQAGPLFLCFLEDVEIRSEVVTCGGFDAGMAQGAADDGHVDAGGEGRGRP